MTTTALTDVEAVLCSYVSAEQRRRLALQPGWQPQRLALEETPCEQPAWPDQQPGFEAVLLPAPERAPSGAGAAPGDQ